MNYSPREGTRRRWCAALAKLVSPSFPDDAAAALCDMLPALQHLPEHLFNQETLIQVAGAKRRQAIPAFDEILAGLNEHRRSYGGKSMDEYRRAEAPEPRPALEAPPDDCKGPTEEEMALVHDLVQQAIRGIKAACIEQRSRELPEQQQRRPLPDVTLKGDALRESRAARGLKLPPEAA